MNRLTALLDANVLYSAGLRDFLLRLADQYLYRPLWSAVIHEEWIANLLANRSDLTDDMLERTRTIMDEHFPEAVVTGYEALMAELDLPDRHDRHVLAAAIRETAWGGAFVQGLDRPKLAAVAAAWPEAEPAPWIGRALRTQLGAIGEIFPTRLKCCLWCRGRLDCRAPFREGRPTDRGTTH